MFDFWFNLLRIGRIVFSLALLVIAEGIFIATGGTQIVIGLAVIGLVTLFASGAGGNKDGYNF